MNSDDEGWRNSGPVYADFGECFSAVFNCSGKLRTSRGSLAGRMRSTWRGAHVGIATSQSLADTARLSGLYPSRRFIKHVCTVLKNVCNLDPLIGNSK